MSAFLFGLTLATALGAATVGGIFFPFSTFAMQGLRRLPPAQGAAAMQEINVMAPGPPLMLVMFGTALLSLAAIVAAAVSWGEDYSPWLLAGGIVYIAGTVVPTATYHVPRNNALAALDPPDPAAAEYWRRYQREWTGMNHVRVVLPIAAAAALIVGLSQG